MQRITKDAVGFRMMVKLLSARERKRKTLLEKEQEKFSVYNFSKERGRNIERPLLEFPGGLEGKDLALLLLWHGFDPWTRNLQHSMGTGKK